MSISPDPAATSKQPRRLCFMCGVPLPELQYDEDNFWFHYDCRKPETTAIHGYTSPPDHGHEGPCRGTRRLRNGHTGPCYCSAHLTASPSSNTESGE